MALGCNLSLNVFGGKGGALISFSPVPTIIMINHWNKHPSEWLDSPSLDFMSTLDSFVEDVLASK